MANSKIYLGSTNIGSLFQGADDISIYLGDEKVYPLDSPLKWKATYSDSSVTSAECDSSSEIVRDEINKTNLVSVEIGDCVTTIGFRAFYQCSSLTSIDIPNSVTSIGEQAFIGCYSLTSITIPSGITSIGAGTFGFCTSLTSIDIPNGVTSIGDGSFQECQSLTNIEIPSGVTSIGERAFNHCSSLTSVTVNATTPPTLGSVAFGDTNNCPIYVPCESLEAYKSATNWSTYADRIQCIQPPFEGKWKATYSDLHTESAQCTDMTETIINNEVIKTDLISVEIGDCVTTIGLSAFTNATSLEEVKLKENLNSIDFGGFKGCVSLTSITIPSSVTIISTDSFSGCTGLESITFLSETPIRIYTNTFYGSTCPIYVPSQSVEAYKAAQGWSTYASRIQAIP